MKHARSFLLVVVAGLVLLPSSASAGDRGHRGRAVVVASPGSVVVASRSVVIVRPGVRVVVAPTPSIVTVSAPHRFFPRFSAPVIVFCPFSPFVVFAPPAIVAPPRVVYAPRR